LKFHKGLREGGPWIFLRNFFELILAGQRLFDKMTDKTSFEIVMVGKTIQQSQIPTEFLSYCLKHFL
jgi:hypothetical protein